MRILLVEDDKLIGDGIKAGLSKMGFNVDWFTDGKTGQAALYTAPYDAVVLDLTLPKVDGLEILRAWRESGRSEPVLILTARDALNQRVDGLRLGADDYLVKPFSFAELLARVRTQLRRGSLQKLPDVLTLADLQLDIVKRRVERDGQRIDLTNKEFNLLHLFLLHPGEVLTRTLIASRVWDMNFDSDTNVVDVAVKRLRQKIDGPFAQPLIHTVHGVGYRCEAEP